jgi:ABC-type cobalamin/Fe3+-siderophores transport system ATPase subunit
MPFLIVSIHRCSYWTQVLRPEKMCLILGGPKSGKSSLLKAIAGASLTQALTKAG